MEGKPALIAIGETIVFIFLYYWVLEGIFGATLGKAIIGIKVIKKDGSACGLKPSLIRNLLRIVDVLGVYLVGFFIAIFSKYRQRLGDHIAKTVVVEMRLSKVLRALCVFLWVAGIAGGIWFSYKIHSGVPATARIRSAETLPQAPVATPGDLKVVNFRFLQSEDGPVRQETSFKPGEKIYTGFDAVGFTTDSERKSHLLLTLVVLDPNGLTLHAPWKHEMREKIEKADAPIHYNFKLTLPPYAPAGQYKIHIRAHDALKIRILNSYSHLR